MTFRDFFNWRRKKNVDQSTSMPAAIEKRSYENDWDLVSTPPPGWLIHLTNNRSKVAVTEVKVMGIPAYFGAVRLVSEQIASFPFGMFKKDGRITVEVVDHVTASTIANPSTILDRFQFMEQLIQQVFLRGNAYVVLKRRNNGDVISMKLIIKKQLPDIYELGDSTWYKFNEGPAYRAEDVIHIKTFGLDGLYGLNPLYLFKETFGVSISQTEFIGSFFGNGAHLSGVLETEKVVTPTQEESILNSFNLNNTGPDKVGKVAMLQGGLKFKPISSDPKSSEYVAIRRASISDISNITGVPVPLLADLERATFSNIENLNQQFVDYVLRVWCKRIETQFNSKLFAYDPAKYFVRFNMAALLRGDTATRSAYFIAAIQNRWMSPNEVRDMEGLNPVEGLDDYAHPLLQNKQSVDAKGTN